MKYFFLTVALIWSIGCQAQTGKLISQEELKSLLNQKQDNISVINFWATWCGPCVKELPLLDQYYIEHKDNVSVALVSMDLVLDPNPDKVHKFLARKKLTTPVYILNEQNPDIDGIEKQWSGALPATIVVNNKTGKRKFIERELKEGELESLIAEIKN